MPDRKREQTDFDFYDDGSTPWWPDRPPGDPAPTLRPDQMLLPVPALNQTFVIPRWNTDDVPPGWVFLAADIDVPRMTRLEGRFIFRRDADTRFVAVWVQWSSDGSCLTATSGEPDTAEPLHHDVDGDMRRIEELVLRRTERYLDVLTMVGWMSVTSDTHLVMLEAIGVGASETLS
jgi:hypothetical protein